MGSPHPRSGQHFEEAGLTVGDVDWCELDWGEKTLKGTLHYKAYQLMINRGCGGDRVEMALWRDIYGSAECGFSFIAQATGLQMKKKVNSIVSS